MGLFLTYVVIGLIGDFDVCLWKELLEISVLGLMPFNLVNLKVSQCVHKSGDQAFHITKC